LVHQVLHFQATPKLFPSSLMQSSHASQSGADLAKVTSISLGAYFSRLLWSNIFLKKHSLLYGCVLS